MKKVLVVFAMCLFSVGLFAQKGSWYIGTTGLFGNMGLGNSDAMTGFWQEKSGDNKTTTFGLAPEVGYNLSDKWVVGLGASFNHRKTDIASVESKITTFGVSPYARYYAFQANSFKFFVQGGFDYLNSKIKDADDSVSQFGIGVKPGVSYGISSKFTVLATFGYAGYRDFDNDKSAFGLDLNLNTLNLGIAITL